MSLSFLLKKKIVGTTWGEIRSNTSLENIILASHLNIILNQAEKRGGSLVRDPIREQVDELVLDWEVSDVIPSKGKFTWTNKRLSPRHISAGLMPPQNSCHMGDQIISQSF